MNEITPPFTYQGRLVFNGIYKLYRDDHNFAPEKILENLPGFEKGTPGKPGSGYVISKLSDVPTRGSKNAKYNHRGVESVLSDTFLIRYKYEEYESDRGIVNGEEKEIYTRSINEVDIYWTGSDHILVRGSRDNKKKAVSELKRIIGGNIRLHEVEFDYRFLLWIFYNSYINESLNNRVKIKSLTDAEIRNKTTQPTEIKRFSNSPDVTKSDSVLRDLLATISGKELSMVGGEFHVEDMLISANIDTRSRIHIKTRHSISDMTDIYRVGTSIFFINTIMDIYDGWSGKERSNKHPPPKFFKDVRSYLSNKGVEVQLSLDDTLIPYYEEKKDE